ncbi:MAG TPA: GNAT family N-acetyltransferase [Anaerovoracaceae bacterium]|nr:GNAT family N-acetyltransferase [Anaerovoracaceae bacterium]
MEIRNITKTELPEAQAENLTIEMYGALEKDRLLGVIATRNEGSHIALFFVRKEYHSQGVGRKSVQQKGKNAGYGLITLYTSFSRMILY